MWVNEWVTKHSQYAFQISTRIVLVFVITSTYLPLACLAASTHSRVEYGSVKVEAPFFLSEKGLQKMLHADNPVQDLQSFAQEHPDYYDFRIYNELRHLYSGTDPLKSAQMSDIILKHQPCHDYIMQILSGWMLGKDDVKATANLLCAASIYNSLKYLHTACLLQVGKIYLDRSMSEKAKYYLGEIAKGKDSDLIQYSALAKSYIDAMDLHSSSISQPLSTIPPTSPYSRPFTHPQMYLFLSPSQLPTKPPNIQTPSPTPNQI